MNHNHSPFNGKDTDAAPNNKAYVNIANRGVLKSWDYRSFPTFTSTNITITYKSGGASGTTVASETFLFDSDGNPTSHTITNY